MIPHTRLTLLVSLVLALVIAASAASSEDSAEKPFLAETDAAMRKMMSAMEIAPSGDVDKDFVAMMVPHHQGAIDMARAELQYGHNELLRRIAQEIVVTQQQEIAAMRMAVGERPPSAMPPPDRPSAPGSPEPAGAPDHDHRTQ